jgi:large subunit ribosomal protein L19
MSETTSTIPDLKPGQTIRVHQIIKEGEKTRTQIFEGIVIALKGGRGMNGTFTVRKMSEGIAVERIFPIHSPLLSKIEVVRSAVVRRSKLYHLRKPGARQLREKKVTKSAQK